MLIIQKFTLNSNRVSVALSAQEVSEMGLLKGWSAGNKGFINNMRNQVGKTNSLIKCDPLNHNERKFLRPTKDHALKYYPVSFLGF